MNNQQEQCRSKIKNKISLESQEQWAWQEQQAVAASTISRYVVEAYKAWTSWKTPRITTKNSNIDQQQESMKGN